MLSTDVNGRRKSGTLPSIVKSLPPIVAIRARAGPVHLRTRERRQRAGRVRGLERRPGEWRMRTDVDRVLDARFRRFGRAGEEF
jgi:hypothetical protein